MIRKTVFVLGSLLIGGAAFAQTQSPPPPPSVTSAFQAKLYGFAEFDSILDSTQSFNDLAGSAPIAHGGSYAGDHSRVTFGARNSRIGFKIGGPQLGEVKTSGIVEMDFMGNQPPGSEAGYFNNPTFRIRHMAVKVETPVVDVLAGQYWELFGWQSAFHPNSVDMQGLPGQVYSRTAQVRISKTFKSDWINVELAAAALRPPQRDSATPDGQAGVKLVLNGWKGVHTAGATGTGIDGAALGISALARRFSVLSPPVTGFGSSASTSGWGVSIDGFLPVIPANGSSRANALSLTGSYVQGAGIADMYSGLTGGVNTLGANTLASTAKYSPDVDSGLVAFDSSGNLHAIDWQSFIVGIQYYLPLGDLWVSANYSQMSSDNIASLSTASTLPNIFTQSRWADANLFWDATAALRFGIEYAYFNQTFADGSDATNHRFQLSAYYLF